MGSAMKKQGEMPTSKVAKFLTDKIDSSPLSQKEIALRLGYTKPNIITMFKQGTTKLPVDKVGLMADALDVDQVKLLKLVMTEYMPDTWEAIQSIVGFAATENEQRMIEIIREASDDTDPRIRNKAQEEELSAWAAKLAKENEGA